MMGKLTALILLGMLTACGGGKDSGVNSVPVSGPTPPTHIPPVDPVALPWTKVLNTGQAHTIQGNVSIIENFPMPQLNKTRRIWIYVPSDYAASGNRYQVLYMQDGQNVFDTATSYAGEWGVDETMQQMEQEDAKFAAIVVAIDNGGSARSDEYLLSGHAKDYVDFIVQTLKPYIDSHYRTLADREHTSIAGSSFGAYVSLYAGLAHQTIFGKVAAFSNVTLYDGSLFNQFIAQLSKQQDMRIYTDIGQPEDLQSFGVVNANQQIFNNLLALGYSAQQVRLVIDPVGIHNEASWRRRFPAAWRWLNP